MSEIYSNAWLALSVVGLIACLAAGLGLVLYRFSAAIVEQKSLRLTGAAAIAWMFFLGMGNFYVNVSTDLQKQQEASRNAAMKALNQASADVSNSARAYAECALHVGDFQCKIPADQLLRTCEVLSSKVQ